MHYHELLHLLRQWLSDMRTVFVYTSFSVNAPPPKHMQSPSLGLKGPAIGSKQATEKI